MKLVWDKYDRLETAEEKKKFLEDPSLDRESRNHINYRKQYNPEIHKQIAKLKKSKSRNDLEALCMVNEASESDEDIPDTLPPQKSKKRKKQD